jgi:CheY-like chemotaxis protein
VIIIIIDGNYNMKPVIMTVDDDPQVLRSVERDLRSKYGNEFRVIRADSGTTALEILKQLKLRTHATFTQQVNNDFNLRQPEAQI